MAEPPTPSEAAIRALARPQSYERGESYYQRGAVGRVVRRGDRLRASVAGSLPDPYTVTITFDGSEVAATTCTCPYDHGGICKHRVAVLLTAVRDPGAITEEEPIADRIAAADRGTLEALLIELAEDRPDVARWLDTRLQLQGAGDGASVSPDPDLVRAEAEQALPKPGQRGHNDAYAEAQRMADAIDGLLEHARLALEVGDGATALDVLEAVAEVLMTNAWTGLVPPDVTALYELLEDLGDLFADAVLAADLDADQRADWAQRFDDWAGDTSVRHFVGRPVFEAAARAAAVGWDDDRLQAAMAGDLDADDGAGAGLDRPADVIHARLRVLERDGRLDAARNLSRAAGHDLAHAKLLVEADRVDDAVAYALEHLTTPRALFDLARTLDGEDHHAASLTVAEHGLGYEGYVRAELAGWLREQAAEAGDEDLALEAAVAAFDARPSLKAYRAAEDVAGEEWESVSEDMLGRVRQSPRRRVGATVDVLLYEDQYDEAIEIADEAGGSRVIESVVEAVVDTRPNWALEACEAQAVPIIENGDHDRYRTAVRWLERAETAARYADRHDEWRDDVATLRDEHYRKYKLRPMLDELLGED